MQQLMPTTPVVMSITNLDPCGGGGIAADIETLASLGCHCTPVITRLCANDTKEKKDSEATDSNLLIEQIRAVLEDISIDLFKIGDIASVANAEAVHTILNDYPHIPVVIDPAFDDSKLTLAISNLLIPHAQVMTLNQRQARSLASAGDTLAACAQEILELGCGHILITGIKDNISDTSNLLFSDKGLIQRTDWEQLPHQYLGAGCTLSAALSAYLAHQINLLESVKQAQEFTWHALRHGQRIGMGQLLPDRMHWCKE
jgi:hydroxymethylpyrimidine/phosphomethylpyrimidine kinase